MNMEFYEDNPDLTEVRATRKSDMAILEAIDLKCQEDPWDRKRLTALVEAEEVHGILGIRKYQNVGFALFNIQNNGEVVFVNRFSVAHGFLEKGVAEKITETLRVTLDGGPLATLRMIVPEYHIGTPMFNKLLGLGFVATGTAPRHCEGYSRVLGTNATCDGIKLELS